jgi:uncharacterized protein YkuJ
MMTRHTHVSARPELEARLAELKRTRARLESELRSLFWRSGGLRDAIERATRELEGIKDPEARASKERQIARWMHQLEEVQHKSKSVLDTIHLLDIEIAELEARIAQEKRPFGHEKRTFGWGDYPEDKGERLGRPERFPFGWPDYPAMREPYERPEKFPFGWPEYPH